MSKILKYVGKGQWQEVDTKDIKAGDKTREITRRGKLSKQEKILIFYDKLHSDILKNGYRSIKVSSLLQTFGISRRTAKAVSELNTSLRTNGIFSMPEFSAELRPQDTIRLYNYPVRQLGDLFPKEEELEKYVEKHELYKKLNIKSVLRQHSPKGTKDRLDFKGDGKNNEIVILELKNKDGGKSAVEQVLRYAGLLKNELPKDKIRMILVTGIQGYETALAINGMNKQLRDSFEWYLYKYHKATKQFDFVKVSDSDISRETQMIS